MADPTRLELAASAARTADGEGSAFDGDRAVRSACVDLDVTAASGTTPTLTVTIEESDDGLVEWTELEAFPDVTGVTKLRLRKATTKRYLRATWVVGGTTPSFTFKVTARLYSHLITAAQLSARVSPTLVGRCFDDSGSGDPDRSALDQVLADASSKVRGRLGPILDLTELDPSSATEVARISLDIAVALMAIRHPEVMRKNGYELMKMADADLRSIRLGQADLGTEAAPDVVDYGVVVSSPPRDNCW